MMAKEKAEIIDQNPIKVNDSNYLMTMEILYNYPGSLLANKSSLLVLFIMMK